MLALDLYFAKLRKLTFTLLKNIPKILYYTTTIAKRESSQVEGSKTLMKLVREDRGPDVQNVKTSRKCNAKHGIT